MNESVDEDLAEEWYVLVGEQQLGPWNLFSLRQAAKDRIIGPDTLVWRAGYETWLPARTIVGLLTPSLPRQKISPNIQDKKKIEQSYDNDIQTSSNAPMGGISKFVLIIGFIAISAVSATLAQLLFQNDGGKATRDSLLNYKIDQQVHDGATISGNQRLQFVASSIQSCLANVKEKTKLSVEAREIYCECYANNMADLFTNGDLRIFQKTKSISLFENRVENVASLCAGKINKR